MEKELKVGTKVKQIKTIEAYGFNYVGEEFEIISNNGTVIVGKCYSKGVGFGVEIDKFDTYFELIEEEKAEDIVSFDTGDTVRITNGVFKNIEGQILVRTKDDIKDNTISIINSNDELRNIIKLHIGDIELIKPFKKLINKQKFNRTIEGYECEVKIRGLRTTVKVHFPRGIFIGSVYCNKNDSYNIEEGIKRAFKKATIKHLTREINN